MPDLLLDLSLRIDGIPLMLYALRAVTCPLRAAFVALASGGADAAAAPAALWAGIVLASAEPAGASWAAMALDHAAPCTGTDTGFTQAAAAGVPTQALALTSVVVRLQVRLAAPQAAALAATLGVATESQRRIRRDLQQVPGGGALDVTALATALQAFVAGSPAMITALEGSRVAVTAAVHDPAISSALPAGVIAAAPLTPNAVSASLDNVVATFVAPAAPPQPQASSSPGSAGAGAAPEGGLSGAAAGIIGAAVCAAVIAAVWLGRKAWAKRRTVNAVPVAADAAAAQADAGIGAAVEDPAPVAAWAVKSNSGRIPA